MVSDSVGIMEDVADDEQCGVSIRYYSVTHNREETITSCEDALVLSARRRAGAPQKTEQSAAENKKTE